MNAFRSEGAKVWKNSKNFVAILHGRLIGLNFAIEHSQQAELLVKYMQGLQFSSSCFISTKNQ